MNNTLTLLMIALLVLMGCQSKDIKASNKTKQDSAINKNKESGLTLRDITDYKMGLLDNNLSKAIEILGQPDDKGESGTGRSGHYVYYDRVKENGLTGHLVIYYNYDDANTEYRIMDVKVVIDGASFYENRYGAVKIKKPENFGVNVNDVDGKIQDIDTQYASLDLTKLQKYTEQYYGKDATYYYDDHLRLRMVKQIYVFSASRNGIRTETYFFINDELRFILEEDNLDDTPPSKKYLYNNNVFKYTLGGNTLECSYQCRFGLDSRPYKMLDRFNSQWGD